MMLITEHDIISLVLSFIVMGVTLFYAGFRMGAKRCNKELEREKDQARAWRRYSSKYMPQPEQGEYYKYDSNTDEWVKRNILTDPK